MPEEPRPLRYAAHQPRQRLSRGMLVIWVCLGLIATGVTYLAVGPLELAAPLVGVFIAIGVGWFIACRTVSRRHICAQTAAFGLPSSVILATIGMAFPRVPVRYPIILCTHDLVLICAGITAVTLFGVSTLAALAVGEMTGGGADRAADGCQEPGEPDTHP